VFENRVLRRIFGPKRDEVTEDWRKFHAEELRKLYSSQFIIRMNKKDEMGGTYRKHEGDEKCIKSFG
jgi:hypothetical protein